MATVNYIWDPVTDSYLMETDGSGNTQAVYTTEPTLYGRVISQRRGGTSSYYHYDGLASTRELTNSSETVTDTNMYDAWGVNRASSGSTVNPFEYVGGLGYYSDTGIAVYYARARSYSGSIARWLCEDPLRVEESRNSFAYVANAPTTKVDPSGLWELRCRWINISNPATGGAGGFLFGVAALCVGVVLAPAAVIWRHCWVQCDGHSYSLLKVNGQASPQYDHADDLNQGAVVASGPDKCTCIAFAFANERGTYPYNPHDCSSNWYANSLLDCCGITVDQPFRAYGWDLSECERYIFDCGSVRPPRVRPAPRVDPPPGVEIIGIGQGSPATLRPPTRPRVVE